MSGKISYSLASDRKKNKFKECSLEPLTEVDEFERGALDSNCCSKVFVAILWIVGVALVASLVSVIVFVEFFYKWSFPLRIDCNLDEKLDFNRCLERGCKYVVTDAELPICFFPGDHGYVKVGSEESTPDGFQLTLHRNSDRTILGNEFDYVRLQVFYETRSRVRFKLAPLNTTRYEAKVFPDTSDTQRFAPLYEVTYHDGKPFGIKVRRNETGTVLFDSALPGMVLSDQFFQLSSRVATGNLFAFGRETAKGSTGLRWETWTLFSKANEGNQTRNPGVHPFYMVVEDDGKAHGVLLLNSNGMDVFAQPEKVITFRTIGGVLDFYLFVGSSPEDVVRQYAELVGRPFMPPQWALGIQAMIPPETDPDDVPQLVDLIQAHGVPLAAIHLDSDLADDLQTEHYAKNLTSHLNARGIKLLLTVNPLASVSEGEKDLIILRSGDGATESEFPKDKAFIDFSNPNATNYWSKRCETLYDKVEYDGLVLVSNEPTYPAHVQWTPCASNGWNEPPYSPGGSAELFYRSVCGDSRQFGGRHYDLHNVYGHMHAEATWKSLKQLAPQKRPVIASRSTFVGSGKYAGHMHRPSYQCSGQAIRASILKVLELSLVGIPYSGVEMLHDFAGCPEAFQERWLQIAALFPLSTLPLPRVMHDLGVEATDIIAKTANATKDVLVARDTLLPYLYTLFFEANTEGLPVARPLFYEFPKDTNAFGTNQQFMLGPAILISSAADEENDIEVYFPKGTWYEFTTGKAREVTGGSFVTLPTFPNPHIHVRGGHIVPLRRSSQGQNSLELFVAPDGNGAATGKIFLDDKESYRDDLKTNSQLMSFTLAKDEDISELKIILQSTSDQDNKEAVINDIRIYGIAKPTSVTIEKKTLTSNAMGFKENVLHLHSLDLKPGNHTIGMTHRQ